MSQIINPHTGKPMINPAEQNIYVLAPDAALTVEEITDILMVMGIVLNHQTYENLDDNTKKHFLGFDPRDPEQIPDVLKRKQPE